MSVKQVSCLQNRYNVSKTSIMSAKTGLMSVKTGMSAKQV